MKPNIKQQTEHITSHLTYHLPSMRHRASPAPSLTKSTFAKFSHLRALGTGVGVSYHQSWWTSMIEKHSRADKEYEKVRRALEDSLWGTALVQPTFAKAAARPPRTSSPEPWEKVAGIGSSRIVNPCLMAKADRDFMIAHPWNGCSLILSYTHISIDQINISGAAWAIWCILVELIPRRLSCVQYHDIEIPPCESITLLSPTAAQQHKSRHGLTYQNATHCTCPI